MRLVKYFNDSCHRDCNSGYIVDYEYCFSLNLNDQENLFELNRMVPFRLTKVYQLDGGECIAYLVD